MRRQSSAALQIAGVIAFQLQFAWNFLLAFSAIVLPASGWRINRLQASANAPGLSASKISSPCSRSYPYAPIEVETIGHFRLKPIAIFNRVPAPTRIGTTINDQVAISESKSSTQPSPSIFGPAGFNGPSLDRPTNRRRASGNKSRIEDQHLSTNQ